MNLGDNAEYFSKPTTSNSAPNSCESNPYSAKLIDPNEFELKCGKCSSIFGLSTIILPELIHIKYNSCKDHGTRYVYQCLVCRWADRLKDIVEEHILYHIIQKELLCLNCQVGLSGREQSSDVMFNGNSSHPEVQLQAFYGIPTESRSPALATVPVSTGRLSASCGECEKDFGSVDDVVASLINLTKETNPGIKDPHIYVCDLCKFSSLKKDAIEVHVLGHFFKDKVFCKLCQKEKIERMKLLTYNLQE